MANPWSDGGMVDDVVETRVKREVKYLQSQLTDLERKTKLLDSRSDEVHTLMSVLDASVTVLGARVGAVEEALLGRGDRDNPTGDQDNPTGDRSGLSADPDNLSGKIADLDKKADKAMEDACAAAQSALEASDRCERLLDLHLDERMAELEEKVRNSVAGRKHDTGFQARLASEMVSKVDKLEREVRGFEKRLDRSVPPNPDEVDLGLWVKALAGEIRAEVQRQVREELRGEIRSVLFQAFESV